MNACKKLFILQLQKRLKVLNIRAFKQNNLHNETDEVLKISYLVGNQFILKI